MQTNISLTVITDMRLCSFLLRILRILCFVLYFIVLCLSCFPHAIASVDSMQASCVHTHYAQLFYVSVTYFIVYRTIQRSRMFFNLTHEYEMETRVQMSHCCSFITCYCLHRLKFA